MRTNAIRRKQSAPAYLRATVINLARTSLRQRLREIRAWRDDGEIRISVQDHGIGIPAADLPHVFDRFHRASNVDARKYAGIGLGLYICRGIAQEHGGRIWVESAVGQGSTFHVALPGAAEGKPN